MGEFVIKLPDVGEGVAEAELVEWMIERGTNVQEDQVLASVMTDKATVEIPSPVEGKVLWLGAEIGEIVAVGAPIIRLEIDGEGNADIGDVVPETPEPEQALSETPTQKEAIEPAQVAKPKRESQSSLSPALQGVLRKEGEKPVASPAVRRRALDAGVDLRRIAGSGPAGRIRHEDLDAFFDADGYSPRASGRAENNTIDEIKVVGLRRKIAEKMALSKSRIPHITYVDEIDVTALEKLREKLNNERREDQPKMTLLPFLMRAMVRAIEDQPQMNARYDDDNGIIQQYGGVHIGVAAQTDTGLVVPVVKHVEAMGVWDCASEIGRLARAAKAGSASREELSGSTITITSLGAMGGIVTTPVINYPEVAIIGVNKMQVLPRWDGSQFVPRKIMNLSSSFDHRVIDGWDAAVFIQRIRSLLEAPATIFIEG